MRRVLFQWRGLTIHAYPALLYLGLVVGVLGGTYGGARHGLDPARTCAAMLLLVPVALVGARLLHVAAHWSIYRREPRRIWRRSDGGAALYGGLVLAFLLSLPLLAGLRLPVGAFWDAATVTILIGMVFTRVGCLLNGCCAGRPAQGPFTLYLPNAHGVWCRRLPTQLLEAGLAVVLLLGSVWVWGRLPFGGALFLLNLAAYGAGRWGLELTRETCDRVGAVRLHRAISAGLAALAVGSFLVVWLLGQGAVPVPVSEPGAGPRGGAWPLWLTPLAVLAVLALFRFVGCAQIAGINDPEPSIPYPQQVMNDNPVAYWRLQEKDPTTLPPDWPKGATAKNEVAGSPNGTYERPPGNKIDPAPNSLAVDPALLQLGVTPGLLAPLPSDTAIRVKGGFIKVGFVSKLNPNTFTLEAFAEPEWDLDTKGTYYTVLASYSNQANAGYAIYGGPVDPANLTTSEYHWQVWMGTGSTSVQLKVKPPGRWSVALGSPSAGTFTLTFKGQTTAGLAHNASASAVQTALEGLSTIGAGNVQVTGSAGGPYAGHFINALLNTPQSLTGSGAGLTGGSFDLKQDLGPKVEKKPTYLVVTYDGTNKYFLFIHFANRDMDWAKYELELSSGSYKPNSAMDLFIGIINEPFVGPPMRPFWGKIQEVAIYDNVLAEARILFHGIGAFNQ